MDTDTKGEIQYRSRIDFIKKRGIEKLGLMTAWAWHDDPKHLLFTLARYKFVAKMFTGFDHVLEVGCGDGFASRIVAQAVNQMTAVDFDSEFIRDANTRDCEKWAIKYMVWNAVEHTLPGEYDGVFALDVLEHIPQENETDFIYNITAPLRQHGVAIIGLPSIHSQVYASPQSKEGHINCKDQAALQIIMKRFFHNVFIFSMNDEMVHTGFPAMAHYLFALCCGKKE